MLMKHLDGILNYCRTKVRWEWWKPSMAISNPYAAATGIRTSAGAGHAHQREAEPMLLRHSESLLEGPGWTYELKLDGFRALAIKSGGTVGLLLGALKARRKQS
jgi:ATP-dependent DNA ligase